jgi:hypothetical protein
MKLALGILALTLLAGTAKADTVSTWNYQGNVNNYGQFFENPGPTSPNPCNCALTGTVTLDNGNPVSWSFSAGAVTWNNNNSSFTQFNGNLVLPADPSPLFTLWNVALVDTQGDTFFTRRTTFSMLDAYDFSSNGLIVQGDPGTWSDPVGTPEPGTFALLVLGLAALTLLRRLA